MRWLLVFAMLLASVPAAAHKPSDSYLALRVEDSIVDVQWDIALRDLEYAVGIDANDDGAITWEELQARHDAISAYALARLNISADGAPCLSTDVEHQVDRHSDGSYAVLRFAAVCPKQARTLEAEYTLFFDLDPLHRGLARLEQHGDSRSLIFSPEQRRQRLATVGRSSLRQFLDFAREGVWHIWTGFDHVLFLLSLLLPAVLERRAGRWVPIPGFRQALWKTFVIVTAFTLAHSLTLSLAALEIVTLPARWVESAIAASIAILPYLLLWAAGINTFGFAGTSILIAVGVALELMRQIDSQLMLRNYEGFLK